MLPRGWVHASVKQSGVVRKRISLSRGVFGQKSTAVISAANDLIDPNRRHHVEKGLRRAAGSGSILDCAWQSAVIWKAAVRVTSRSPADPEPGSIRGARSRSVSWPDSCRAPTGTAGLRRWASRRKA
jgi:hypothetical protein